MDGIRAKRAQIQERMKQPDIQNNSQLRKIVEDENVRLGVELANTFIKSQDLARLIRSIESYLRDFDRIRNNEIAKLRKTAEEQYRRDIWNNINNFHSWEFFFKNNNNYVRDFFLLAGIKDYLSELVDNELPQRQSVIYRQRLNAFLMGWGIL
jgi:hypothetical protein